MNHLPHIPRALRLAIGVCIAALVLGPWTDHTASADEPAPASSSAPKITKVSQGKSAVIYPASATHQIAFAHSKHAALDCKTCHASIEASTRASDRNTPSMQACTSCHTGDKEGVKPALGDCAGCHQGHPGVPEAKRADITTPKDWQAVRPAPMILPTPQANLKFSHKAHATLGCQSCHGDKAAEPTMPSEASCQTCHNGKIAQDACSTCHPTTKRGAILETDFTDPVTGKQLTLAPSDHTVDWLERHGAMAKTNASECTSCHTESSCAECHQGSDPRTLLAAHPPNYIVLHRVAAKGQGSTCTSCHQQESTCMDCHMRSKAATIEGSKPPPRLAFHPPGWLEATNPSNHGVMARRNLNECASCHQERDCVSCHQGINPHPPDFRGNCDRMLRANPTPCLACHTNATCSL